MLSPLPEYWFQCKHCGSLEMKEHFPRITNCTKQGTHHWIKLAEVGPTGYHCDKCDTHIKTSEVPTIKGCPSANFHAWQKQP